MPPGIREEETIKIKGGAKERNPNPDFQLCLLEGDMQEDASRRVDCPMHENLADLTDSLLHMEAWQAQALKSRQGSGDTPLGMTGWYPSWEGAPYRVP